MTSCLSPNYLHFLSKRSFFRVWETVLYCMISLCPFKILWFYEKIIMPEWKVNYYSYLPRKCHFYFRCIVYKPTCKRSNRKSTSVQWPLLGGMLMDLSIWGTELTSAKALSTDCSQNTKLAANANWVGHSNWLSMSHPCSAFS